MTTLLLVDDQALLRRGFRRVLEAEDDLEVVGEADDGRAALQQLGTTKEGAGARLLLTQMKRD